MIYLDLGGRGPGLVRRNLAVIPASDRGLLYGDGLFETVLVSSGQMPLFDLHLERLTASAAALQIPCSEDQIREAAQAVVLAARSQEMLALRITLTRGSGARRGYAPAGEAEPTLLISASSYSRPQRPLSAITASMRINPASPLARHKSLSALEKVMAAGEAAAVGVEEALLLNVHGRVAEASAANLFIRRGERWITPPLQEGALPGVMRRRMLQVTGAAQEPLTPEDLWQSDGVCLTSALMGCVPLGWLDGTALPPSGPLADLVQDLFAL